MAHEADQERDAPFTAQLHLLSEEARSWLSAEAALARAEAAIMARRAVRALLCAAAALALVLVMLVIAAETVAVALAGIVSPGLAGTIVAAALLVLAGFAAWRARVLLRPQPKPQSLFLRWLNGRPDGI
ncbi:MAG: phage holin family protein [Hyphomicrobiales bacterium]